MKWLLSSILCMFLAGPAVAQGINLFWDDCYLGGGRSVNDDACEATRTLIISVDTPQTFSDILGALGYIDVSFDTADIPDYWRVDAGGCRPGGLSADALVGSGSPPYSCMEPWSQSGGQVAGVQLVTHEGSHFQARITWIIAVPATVQLDTSLANEWYVMKLVFQGGTTSCTGCEVAANFLATEVRLARHAGHPLGDVFIYQPVSSLAIWAPHPTPVHNSTWGQIKSMYR